MRRSEVHQGVRVIKFRDVFGRYESSEFSQLEAAELLGVSERTFRRWSHRYETVGEAGLLDRRLGRASGKRVPVDRAEEVEALYRTRYSGFTARHFHEHLARDHNFIWSYTWTKAFLQSRGLLERARRRGAHGRKAPAVAVARHDAAPSRSDPPEASTPKACPTGRATRGSRATLRWT